MLFCGALLFTLAVHLQAEPVVVMLDEGVQCELNVDDSRSIYEIAADVLAAVGLPLEGNHMIIEVDPAKEGALKVHLIKGVDAKAHGEYLGHPRNPEAPLTATEKNDIRFIITTLANKNLISIAKHRSELEAAGDRIDHLHPLVFLTTAFTDEELKVGVRKIRGRGWIWSDFVGGLTKCLATESSCNNLKQEQIASFARKVGIKPELLYPAYDERRWEAFLDELITHVPRTGDPGRIDS